MHHDSVRDYTMTKSPQKPLEFDWMNPLKALALLGVLANHFVESFGSGPWFTNPSNNWPDFSIRITRIFPPGDSILVRVTTFVGWLGDSAPGVFILLSGLGLTWAALHRPPTEMRPTIFYRRRLGRILPLYVGMHFVVFAMALLKRGGALSIANTKSLLSMFGLRFSDTLFFYINPSWWFVWLILQLYLIYPFLFRFMQRLGPKRFFISALVFTLLSRLYGITLSQSVYFWMTGMFFGTRLAEFAAGMVIASFFAQGDNARQLELKSGRLFALSLLAYASGLMCSFTWAGSLVSNFLVTLGMTGLFYALWRGVIRPFAPAQRITDWMGVQSYGVYLLHQVPLAAAVGAVGGSSRAGLAAAILALAASFPASWAIEKAVNWTMSILRNPVSSKRLALLTLGPALGAAMLASGSRVLPLEPRSVSLFLAVCLLGLIIAEVHGSAHGSQPLQLARLAAISFLTAKLFVFPQDKGTSVALVFASLVAIAAGVITRAQFSRSIALAAPFAVSFSLLLSAEVMLRSFAPLEAGRWGEFPILQPHPTRIYGLRANRQVHLRYNNYSYTVRTNSLGLASPEIHPVRPTQDTFRILTLGDAFTMPEGVEYPLSYPALLQEFLQSDLSPRQVQVINAGVTGYGPVEESQQLAELGPLFRPDVVVYQFFIDDFSQIDDTAGRKLHVIGFRSRNDYEYLLDPATLQLDAYLDRIKLLAKELVTGQPGGYRSDKALLRFYSTSENSLYTERRLQRLQEHIARMHRISRDIGATLVVVFVPGAVTVSKPSDLTYFPWDQHLSDPSKYDLTRPQRALARITDPLGISVMDLTPYLSAHPIQPVYFPASWHWNPAGHRVAARAIATFVREHARPPREFLRPRL
jgi:peptidoglycan/LPS O-acetylase OafA/YrhL